jgi:hypothetical protein
MALQDPEERRDVGRDVVDDLDLRPPRSAKEDAAHADERLGIELVRRVVDELDQAAGEIALAADVAGDRAYRIDRLELLVLH